MSDKAISTDNQGQSSSGTIEMTSSGWLFASRIAFVVILILSIYSEISVFPDELEYLKDLFADSNSAELALLIATFLGLRALLSLIFMGTGTLIYLRKPQHPIIVLASMWMISFGALGIAFYNATSNATAFYGEGLQRVVITLIGSLAWALIFVLVTLFPDGKVVPRWAIAPLLGAFILVASWANSGDSEFYPENWHPLLLSGSHLIIVGSLVAASVQRYRKHSTPLQRQQTKWVILGFAVALLSAVLFTTVVPELASEGSSKDTLYSHISYLISDIAFLAVPTTITLALLRSRLWDVDLVINRSLVYGAVILTGVMIFATALFSLQLIVGRTEPLIALIISLAMSALVFNMVRAKVQEIVDRYIYHLRFNLQELNNAQRELSIDNPGALSGRQLGKYQVLDLIGKGGMGEVYKAVHNGQTVAIKTLLTEKTADNELLMRFQREAETGMALKHPNIASVHSIDRQDDLTYMVMDYLEGTDLSQKLKDAKTLDATTVTEIVMDLAEALTVAHEQGLVHRDIKPSNVMLVLKEDSETYRCVLMDFGITKVKEANTLTGTGAIGTIDYMAPEQILNAREVDLRADIYSLGVMMYEMITGERPFKGTPGQVLFAHIQQPAPDPRDIAGDFPRPLAKAVLKALEKDPNKRFQSAMELAESLR